MEVRRSGLWAPVNGQNDLQCTKLKIPLSSSIPVGGKVCNKSQILYMFLIFPEHFQFVGNFFLPQWMKYFALAKFLLSKLLLLSMSP